MNMKKYYAFGIATAMAISSATLSGSKLTKKVGDSFYFEYADTLGFTGETYQTSFTIKQTKNENCIKFEGKQPGRRWQGPDSSTSSRWTFKAICPGKQVITFTRSLGKKDKPPRITTEESHEITVVP